MTPLLMMPGFTGKINTKKSYGHDEEYFRYQVFKKHMQFVQDHYTNSKNKTYTVAMNQFADLPLEEFKKKFTGLNLDLNRTRNEKRFQSYDVPSSVNWVEKGAVTPVKNQGQCGSCWSFSATGSLEGLNYLKNGNLLSFSEQQLVDCSGAYGNHGCNGGLMDNAFRYVESHGITLESLYPYQAQQGSCQSNIKSYFRITGYTDVPQQQPDQMQAAVAQQPVSVAIDAACTAFQLYHSGVFNDSCGTSLDHGVLTVGYGSESGEDFWLVKNSWGASWGENGYIKLARSNEQGPGSCGILNMASYPTL